MGAVREQINRLMFVHSDDFNGVPLLYTDLGLSPGENFGRIIAEAPYVHLHVQASLLVFSPIIGDRIVGKINKVSCAH